MTDALQKDLLESRQAKELLDHPMLQQAFTEIEKEIFEVWTSEAKTPQDREMTYARHKALQWFKAKLTQKIDGGKFAQKELERLEKAQSKSH